MSADSSQQNNHSLLYGFSSRSNSPESSDNSTNSPNNNVDNTSSILDLMVGHFFPHSRILHHAFPLRGIQNRSRAFHSFNCSRLSFLCHFQNYLSMNQSIHQQQQMNAALNNFSNNDIHNLQVVFHCPYRLYYRFKAIFTNLLIFSIPSSTASHSDFYVFVFNFSIGFKCVEIVASTATTTPTPAAAVSGAAAPECHGCSKSAI